MKSLLKSVSVFALAGMLVLCVVSTAEAQRGRPMMRGGIHIGFGGPRFGFGFGYRPFYAYPRLGFYINTLPYGYYPFYYGPDQYFYYGGSFYRPYNNGYQVTAPPIGAAVPTLPPNARPITIDGQQYFEANGVYYKQSTDEKGRRVFVVSGKDGVLNTDRSDMPVDSAYDQNAPIERYIPHVDDVVTQLPDGCHKVTLNGKKYFVSPDDIYYEEFTDANQNTSYRIASVPAQEEAVPTVPAQQPKAAPKPVKPGDDI